MEAPLLTPFAGPVHRQCLHLQSYKYNNAAQLPYAFCDVKNNNFSPNFSTGSVEMQKSREMRILSTSNRIGWYSDIGRPTVSSCYFLRILESNDDESSNQQIFRQFFPHDQPRLKQKSTAGRKIRRKIVSFDVAKCVYGSTVSYTRNDPQTENRRHVFDSLLQIKIIF